ncbi:putative RNA-directed DNA polymerase [Tanacetum coccineum]
MKSEVRVEVVKGSESHIIAALKVLRYLKTSPGYVNMFLDFVSICVSKFDSRKGKKQATLSRSSTEVEYRCMASTAYEVIWLINLLKDLNMEGLLHLPLYCDSTYAIQIDVDPVFHEKTKHFETEVHMIREKVASGVISIIMVNLANQIADIFTKGLSVTQHKQFCLKLNMVDILVYEFEKGC